MKDRIETELDRIEREHAVTILFACESGSRAWGFPSRDSDWDVRFIYHHPAAWYLDLAAARDVIEEPITDLLDVSGWDLDKTLRLLRKSNPNILEWVHSPIVYRERSAFGAVRALIDESFDHRASLVHYLNMAANNKRQYLRGDEVKIKKYLYVIRPLLCALWVDAQRTQPPMLYREMLAAMHGGSPLEARVEDLIRRKEDVNEGHLVARDAFLDGWIEETVQHVESVVPAKAPRPDWAPYNATFREVLGI